MFSSNNSHPHIIYSEYKYIEANSSPDETSCPKNTNNVASPKSCLEKNEGIRIFSHSEKNNEGIEIKQVGPKKNASVRPDILADLRKVSYWCVLWEFIYEGVLKLCKT